MTDPIDRALVAYYRSLHPDDDRLSDAKIVALFMTDTGRAERTAMAAAIRAAVGEPAGWMWQQTVDFIETPITRMSHARPRWADYNLTPLYALNLLDAQSKPAAPTNITAHAAPTNATWEPTAQSDLDDLRRGLRWAHDSEGTPT